MKNYILYALNVKGHDDFVIVAKLDENTLFPIQEEVFINNLQEITLIYDDIEKSGFSFQYTSDNDELKMIGIIWETIGGGLERRFIYNGELNTDDIISKFESVYERMMDDVNNILALHIYNQTKG